MEYSTRTENIIKWIREKLFRERASLRNYPLKRRVAVEREQRVFFFFLEMLNFKNKNVYTGKGERKFRCR